MEMEDRQNGPRCSEAVTQVQRLAKIHLKLREMYLEDLSSEAISPSRDQSITSPEGYGCFLLVRSWLDH